MVDHDGERIHPFSAKARVQGSFGCFTIKPHQRSNPGLLANSLDNPWYLDPLQNHHMVSANPNDTKRHWWSAPRPLGAGAGLPMIAPVDSTLKVHLDGTSREVDVEWVSRRNKVIDEVLPAPIDYITIYLCSI